MYLCSQGHDGSCDSPCGDGILAEADKRVRVKIGVPKQDGLLRAWYLDPCPKKVVALNAQLE